MGEEQRLPGGSAWPEYHAASRYYPGTANILADEKTARALQRYVLDYKFASHVNFSPDEIHLERVNLVDVLARRKSVRRFGGQSVTKETVDAVINHSFLAAHRREARPTPSAGALYPVELYLIPFLVSGFSSGTIAHLGSHRRPHKEWAVLPHTVEAEQLNRALLGQLPPGSCGVVVLSAVVAKAAAKYGERGYRFCLIEVGHVAQNLTLVLEAIGMASVCIGGFADGPLNSLLHLDGYNEAALYAIPFGVE